MRSADTFFSHFAYTFIVINRLSSVLLLLSLGWANSASAQIHSAKALPALAALSTRADAARDANRLQEAVPLYRKALALRPGWKEGWWSLGTILYDQDSYAAAARAFRRLLANDSKNGTAHLMLGLCEYQLNQDDSALQDLRLAKNLGVKKDATQLPHVLLYHEAMLLLRKSRFEGALEALRFLTKDGVHSDDLDAALGMGVLMMRPKDAPAQGSAEREVVLRAGRAEGYGQLKKDDDARKIYSDLMQEFPSFPNLHYAYGRFLLSVLAPAEAVTQFELELKNNPKQSRARLQIAATHYRVDSAAGIPYAEEVVKTDPSYPFGHYMLGLLYLDTGDATRAIPELENAVKMVPQATEFYFSLGNAYAKAGRKEDATRARAVFVRLSAKESENGPDAYGESKPMDPKNLDQGSGATPQR